MMHPPTPLPGGLLLDHELRELTHEKERVRGNSGYIVCEKISLTLTVATIGVWQDSDPSGE